LKSTVRPNGGTAQAFEPDISVPSLPRNNGENPAPRLTTASIAIIGAAQAESDNQDLAALSA
jgi:hypothetical protein